MNPKSNDLEKIRETRSVDLKDGKLAKQERDKIFSDNKRSEEIKKMFYTGVLKYF